MVSENISKSNFRYTIPSDKWLIKNKREIEDALKIIKEKFDFDDLDIEINYLVLLFIFVRVDERSDYYLYYHSTEDHRMKMSIHKEMALIAYWILKYKPFRLKNINDEEDFYEKYKCSVNDLIATLLVIGYILKNTDGKVKDFSSQKIETLVYDFAHRDISKEAMIMYIESFVKNQ